MTGKTAFATWLEAVQERWGLRENRSAFARRLGVSQSLVVKWIDQGVLPRARNIRRIALATGVSEVDLNRLIGHIGPAVGEEAPLSIDQLALTVMAGPFAGTSIPLTADLLDRLADRVAEQVLEIIGREPPPRLQRRQRRVADRPTPYFGDWAAFPPRGNDLPEWLDLTRFALRVVGDCLAPEIADGSLLIFDRERSAHVGDIVAAIVNGERHVKKVLKLNGEWVLADARDRLVVERNNIEIWGVRVVE